MSPAISPVAPSPTLPLSSRRPSVSFGGFGLKLILATSARRNDGGNPGWQTGARKYGAGFETDRYHFNHEYGFGVVDAKAAVDLAKGWSSLPPMRSHTVQSSVASVSIPDAPAAGNPTTVTESLTVDAAVGFVEFVEVAVSFQHDSFRDLQIELVAPSGSISQLAAPFSTHGKTLVPLHGSFRFGSALHLGEDPNGKWQLRVTDRILSLGGTLDSWSLTVYGHGRTPGPPSVDLVTAAVESLTVAWSAPNQTWSPAVTAYDLRHIQAADDETIDSNWTVVENVWTSTGGGDLEHDITGLTGGTQYDVQVRSVNAAGDGPWSEKVTGTAAQAPTSACTTGGAVANAAGNPGLVSDCSTLLAARDALAGAGSLNWESIIPIAQWDGVTVRGTPRRVTRLILPKRGLSGRIPAGLGSLSMLTKLNLRTNELSGTIPAELGDLSNLVRLNLHTNKLTGSIPDLSGTTTLQELYLSNNDLDGPVPSWLGTMTSVRELWLWGNELSGAIPDLSGMTGLDRLKLQSNKLTGGIPLWLGRMTDLRYLYIHLNPLNGEISPELGGMSNLRFLWLHSSQLTGGIPKELSQLYNLVDLNLRNNKLDGSIPKELGGLSNLKWLRLHRNQLTGGIPTELGDLSNLEKGLWLHGNKLSGSIPDSLGRLTKLERLWLSDNELSGEIPEELGALRNLAQWRLASNDFTGCVPSGLVAVMDSDLDRLGLTTCRAP